jgi:hypothetical protein
VTETAGSEVDRLESILAELELSPAELRRDPSGEGWLPAEARALVQAHPRCRESLDEFVSGELDLWSARPEAAVPPTVDPFFTARVVGALPRPRSGTGLSPRRRALLLGLFHVVAGLLAYVVLTMVPESTARWAEQAHRMLTWGSESTGGPWLAATAVGAVVLLAVVLGRTHTPAA